MSEPDDILRNSSMACTSVDMAIHNNAYLFRQIGEHLLKYVDSTGKTVNDPMTYGDFIAMSSIATRDTEKIYAEILKDALRFISVGEALQDEPDDD